MLAADAAHLEDVGKVAGKRQRQRQMDLLRAVVGECDPLAQRAIAQVDRSRDVDGVLEKDNPFVLVDVRIGEIDVEVEVVVPDRRAQ